MKRVLIVDDNRQNLTMLRALFEGHGYVVDEARHGADALQQAHAAPPQLVVSDLLMPVMDGYTLLREWGKDEQLQAIPFVVYTATYVSASDERLALDLGADAFILKPAEPDAFMAQIEAVLAEQERGGFVSTNAPQAEETVLLREYNEVLIRKLEDKALQLESANRALREEIVQRDEAEAARGLLEAQLRESQKMQVIGTLAGGIAHDFNNIIATILGNVDLASQDAINNRLALESLDEIRKSATRGRELVQQILSFSRRQPTDRKQILLAPVAEEAMRLLRSTVPARVALEFNAVADLPAVLADENQIAQVVINLVSNAMQAMQGRAGCVSVELDAPTLDVSLIERHPVQLARFSEHSGRVVRLSISDDGPGMDAATKSRIFEPFFTTKPVGEGTGLGLSVVHGIVERHGGAICVDSQPGSGARFEIYFPVTTTASADLVPGESAPATAPASGAGGLHILYIDDDESLVFLVKRLLERRGYRLTGYTDAQQGLAALKADPLGFDLVVTDYNMPGMSGLEVALAVRELRADLPVAVASGFIDEALHAQAEGAGVRELIFKANAVEDLCEAFVRLAQTVGSAAPK